MLEAPQSDAQMIMDNSFPVPCLLFVISIRVKLGFNGQVEHKSSRIHGAFNEACSSIIMSKEHRSIWGSLMQREDKDNDNEIVAN